jgi:MDMPI C-terminal domain/Mycothiol maleylpyruvate isomerase N-terminal domain
VEIAAYTDALDRDGAALGDAAERAGLTAPVPACPGWQVRDLLRHETAVHRFDAQSAESALAGAGRDPLTAFAPGFAADGVDELIMGFAGRRRYRLRGQGSHSLVVRSADEPGCWLVELADGTTLVSRGPEGAGHVGCTLSGPAAGLYAFLWNRCPADAGAVTITGDPAVLRLWSSSVQVTW